MYGGGFRRYKLSQLPSQEALYTLNKVYDDFVISLSNPAALIREEYPIGQQLGSAPSANMGSMN